MRSFLHRVLAQRLLMIAVVTALFLTACSKRDDVVAPCHQQGSADTETRSVAGDNGDDGSGFGKDGSLHTRGTTVSDPGCGSGINDDGDDEADGEGNKKRRVNP